MASSGMRLTGPNAHGWGQANQPVGPHAPRFLSSGDGGREGLGMGAGHPEENSIGSSWPKLKPPELAPALTKTQTLRGAQTSRQGHITNPFI